MNSISTYYHVTILRHASSPSELDSTSCYMETQAFESREVPDFDRYLTSPSLPTCLVCGGAVSKNTHLQDITLNWCSLGHALQRMLLYLDTHGYNLSLEKIWTSPKMTSSQ